jgi:hypothetical protein
MTIAADSLLLRPKLDYDGGYDVAVKGLNVVMCNQSTSFWNLGKEFHDVPMMVKLSPTASYQLQQTLTCSTNY